MKKRKFNTMCYVMHVWTMNFMCIFLTIAAMTAAIQLLQIRWYELRGRIFLLFHYFLVYIYSIHYDDDDEYI